VNFDCVLVSDFNVENLAGFLNQPTDPTFSITASVAPFGQVAQSLMADQLDGCPDQLSGIMIEDENVLLPYKWNVA